MVFRRSIALASTGLATLAVTAGTAFAQRPPAPGQGPPQFSLERAWAWLTARPGVMIAIGVCIVALIYMIVTRSRKSST